MGCNNKENRRTGCWREKRNRRIPTYPESLIGKIIHGPTGLWQKTTNKSQSAFETTDTLWRPEYLCEKKEGADIQIEW
ncbi:MAG: hypothetical protein CSB23_01840 [Deltaproteobacteria bacterium]|nr:MAG: hypothetical protein CSB23_01840 [Deltaproteobacteria bacterium]